MKWKIGNLLLFYTYLQLIQIYLHYKIMSIIWTTGNIFDLDVDAMVNPINAYGISGKGLAKEFALRYPDNQAQLRERISLLPHFSAGDVIYTYDSNRNPNYIYNVATKQHWRNPSKYQYVENILYYLTGELYSKADINTIAIPPIGCGLGELNYANVKHLFIQCFEPLSTVVYCIDKS